MIRIAVMVSSLRNVFVDAWIFTLKSSGARVVIAADLSATNECSVPPELADEAVVLDAQSSIGDWAASCEAKLGGAPDVLFIWWGLGALTSTQIPSVWRSAPRVLCVDTLPNASRLRAEIKEWWLAQTALRGVAAVVVTSEQMKRSLDSMTFGRTRTLRSLAVLSPFPLRAHSDDVPVRRPDAKGIRRYIFTGRSDFLFRRVPGMEKDVVGPQLHRLIQTGHQVSVQRPARGDAAQSLLHLGFEFYQPSSRVEMFDGTFARTLNKFDAQIVTYNVANATIRRRVATGLSTRFASAVCASSAVLVPESAIFAKEWFDRYPLGFIVSDFLEISRPGWEEADELRKTQWTQHHEAWAGEASAAGLREIWAHL